MNQLRSPDAAGGMNKRLPPIAVVVGLAGLLPFLGCGFGTLAFHDPVQAARALTALIAYGAVILSFLGAVHWGLALADETGLAEASRYGLGVLPALLGWVALLAMADALPRVALLLLAFGFIAVMAAEQRAALRGLVPPSYLALRWVLSTVVLVVLLGVLVMRVAGLHVGG